MQSSTPTGQFPHPKHSVHALKPMIKVLLFGHTRRKPKQESPDDPAYELAIDLKYPCLGLIAAGIGTFTKRSGFNGWGAAWRRNQERNRLQFSFRPISRNSWRRCLRIVWGSRLRSSHSAWAMASPVT